MLLPPGPVRPDPADRPPPQVGPLVHALAGAGVEWVLTGSAVLVLYGAAVRPGDLDVVPAPDTANLARLAGLLTELQAVPAHHPGWDGGLRREECLAWRPEPATAQHLDHLFVTTLGMLDIPRS